MVQTVKSQQEKARLKTVAALLLKAKLDIDVLPFDVQFREAQSTKHGYVWTVSSLSRKPLCLEKKPKDYTAAERSRVLQMLVTGQLTPVRVGPAPIKRKKSVAIAATPADVRPITPIGRDICTSEVSEVCRRSAKPFVSAINTAARPAECPRTPVKKFRMQHQRMPSFAEVEPAELDEYPPAYADLSPRSPFLPAYLQARLSAGKDSKGTSPFDHSRHAEGRVAVAKAMKSISEYNPSPLSASLVMSALEEESSEAASPSTMSSLPGNLGDIMKMFRAHAIVEQGILEASEEADKFKATLDLMSELYAAEMSLVRSHIAKLENRKEELKREAQLCQTDLNKVVRDYHMA